MISHFVPSFFPSGVARGLTLICSNRKHNKSNDKVPPTYPDIGPEYQTPYVSPCVPPYVSPNHPIPRQPCLTGSHMYCVGVLVCTGEVMPKASPAMTIAVTPSLVARGTSSASSSYHTNQESYKKGFRVNMLDTARKVNNCIYIRTDKSYPHIIIYTMFVYCPTSNRSFCPTTPVPL